MNVMGNDDTGEKIQNILNWLVDSGSVDRIMDTLNLFPVPFFIKPAMKLTKRFVEKLTKRYGVKKLIDGFIKKILDINNNYVMQLHRVKSELGTIETIAFSDREIVNLYNIVLTLLDDNKFRGQLEGCGLVGHVNDRRMYIECNKTHATNVDPNTINCEREPPMPSEIRLRSQEEANIALRHMINLGVV